MGAMAKLPPLPRSFSILDILLLLLLLFLLLLLLWLLLLLLHFYFVKHLITLLLSQGSINYLLFITSKYVYIQLLCLTFMNIQL